MYESASEASPRFAASSANGIDVGFKGAADLLRAWRDGRTPDSALTVSTWADSHRLLSPRGANEAGRWRTSRTPYLREIMDALSPSHPAQRVVVMKGAQIGATEAGNNWIGYIIHHAPGPMLAVQPTVELAKRFSQQRVDPLIDESPVLRDKVAPARSRDAGNTVLSKEFPGGILVMTGANSAVGLRSMPVRYLFVDEVDAYPLSADEEGEPVALAEARTWTFSWRDLKAAGCERIYDEQVSWSAITAANSPPRSTMCATARCSSSPASIAWHGRWRHLVEIIELLEGKRVRLRILGLGIDTGTPTGRLMLTMLRAIGEFERALMLERQREGIAKAKALGKYKGRARPPRRCASGIGC